MNLQRIRLFRFPLAWLLLLLISTTTVQCYSRFRIENSRLPVIKDYKDLRFIVIDTTLPFTDMWLLKNPDVVNEVLSGNLTPISEKEIAAIASINTSNEKAVFNNLVLIYVNHPAAQTFTNST